jgi:hypothetical protein
MRFGCRLKPLNAAGIGLCEIARKMNIPEGTVLAHAKRQGWTQTDPGRNGQLAFMQADAINAAIGRLDSSHDNTKRSSELTLIENYFSICWARPADAPVGRFTPIV